jgi:hypothetical protein
MKIHTFLAATAAFVLTSGPVKAAVYVETNPPVIMSPPVTYETNAVVAPPPTAVYETVVYETNAPPLYRAQEFSLDLFGSYINHEEKFSHAFHSDIRHGFFGGGVGLNYFFLRWFGIGGDVNFSDHPGRITDQVMGNGIIRVPIGDTGLAPYAFGGGGRGIWPSWEWLADAGVGAEFRFRTSDQDHSPRLGLFGDARYIWAQNPNDRALFRVGLRVVF